MKKYLTAVTIVLMCAVLSATAAFATDLITVKRVQINMNEMSLRVGQSRLLYAWVTPYDATYTWIEWSSSDPDVVKVDEEGNVTGVSPGTATITASSTNGKKTNCKVTVTESRTSGVTVAPRYNTLSITDIRDPVETQVYLPSSGDQVVVKFEDYDRVAVAAIQSAKYIAEFEYKTSVLEFGWSDDSGRLLRIDTTDTKNMGYSYLYVGFDWDSELASELSAKYGDRWLRAVQMEQQGDLKAEVELWLPAEGGTPTKLYAYSYDGAAFTPLENAVTVEGGYLKIATDVGGTLVLTSQQF